MVVVPDTSDTAPTAQTSLLALPQTAFKRIVVPLATVAQLPPA